MLKIYALEIIYNNSKRFAAQEFFSTVELAKDKAEKEMMQIISGREMNTPYWLINKGQWSYISISKTKKMAKVEIAILEKIADVNMKAIADWGAIAENFGDSAKQFEHITMNVMPNNDAVYAISSLYLKKAKENINDVARARKQYEAFSIAFMNKAQQEKDNNPENFDKIMNNINPELANFIRKNMK